MTLNPVGNSHLLTCFILLLFMALISENVEAAMNRGSSSPTETSPRSRQAPAKAEAIAGQTVKTDYFTVRLPANWSMPYPVNKKPDGTSAVFTDEKTQVTVTLNIIKAPLSTKQFMDKVLPNMEKSQLKPAKPELKGKLYRVALNGQAKGEAWFASDNKLCVATVILAPRPDVHSAASFLQALQSPIRNMFPLDLK